MEENIFPESPTSKLYTENAIRIGTFLGGPLVAGYLIAENYRQSGDAKKVQMTWLYSILATIIIFVIAWSLPPRTPSYLLPIAYTIGAYELAKKLFSGKIKAHLAAGGQTWPIWRAVLAGLVGLIVIVAIIFAFFFFTDQQVA